jgi:hypothetical protein
MDEPLQRSSLGHHPRSTIIAPARWAAAKIAGKRTS